MTGDQAVARVLGEILAELHPGTTWLPVDPTQNGSDARPGKVVRRLATPEDPDAIPVQPDAPADDSRAA